MAIATPTHLSNIQALRGLAALLVLLSHLVPMERAAATNPILPDSLMFGMMGVDLFFVISGFIMVFITRDWIAPSIARAPEFLFARATRIYPLYWIVTLALFMVWLMQPGLIFSSSPNEPTLLNTAFLIPAYAYPLLEVGWTLVYELGFYVGFAILLVLPERWRGLGLIIWGAIVGTGLALGWQEQNAWMFHLINPLTFEFLAGAFAALIFLRVQAPNWLAMTFALSGLAGMLVWLFIGDATFEDGWPRVLRFTLPATALILGSAWLNRANHGAPKFAVWLGDISYSLYLTHLLSLGLVAAIWRAAGLSDLPSVIPVLIMMAFAIITAAMNYRLIERPLHDAARSARHHIFRTSAQRR